MFDLLFKCIRICRKGPLYKHKQGSRKLDRVGKTTEHNNPKTMSIDDLTGLITMILAISLASERLVTFLKTLIPWLADKAPGQLQPPESDYWRQVIVMLLAFVSCWLTSAFLIKDCTDFLCLADLIDLKDPLPDIPVYLMALLASGGSAFWASILAYTRAVKDIKKEQISQEKVNTLKQFTIMEERTFAFKANMGAADAIAYAVKKIILDISELPGDPANLDVSDTLSDLNYGDKMCNDLAHELNTFVKTIKVGAGVNNAEISASMTVQKVINLVKSKLA